MSKKSSFLILGLTVVIACGAYASAAPQMINYQGQLLDSDGNPVTGSCSVEFLIYNVETGGTAQWSEIQNLVLTNGMFNVLLGSVTPIAANIFNNPETFLTIKIGTDGEMLPRKRLGSVAYAFQANNADSLSGYSADQFIKSGQSNSIGKNMIAPDILSSIDGVSNDGGDVDLIAGSNVTITPDNGAKTITISASGGTTGDNLGNHAATQNIKLNTHWLSGDGGDEGVYVSAYGRVGIGKSSLDRAFEVEGDVEASGFIQSKKSPGGYLGGTYYGAYGHYTTGVFGYLGGSSYSVYGQKTSTKFGYLGGSSGAYGQYSDSRYGSLGSSNYGVYGQYNSSIIGAIGATSFGVWGGNGGHYGYLGGTLYGVYGKYDNDHYGYLGGSSLGGYVKGDLHVSGSIVKSTSSFKIDHPIDPANKYLFHSIVESPDMMNIYNGNVVLDANGEAVVELPDWFEALNMDFRYQLTCIGGFADVYISEEVHDNQFKVAGGDPGLKVSWQVTGIRHDPYAEANRIQVEVEKTGDERGTYLNPELYGLSIESRVDYINLRENDVSRKELLQKGSRIQAAQEDLVDMEP